STTTAQPALTFPDSGLYVITLAIGNPGCDTIRLSDTILIGQPPTVALAPIADACGELRFTPQATYSTLSRIDSVRWTFPAEAGAVPGSSFFPAEQVIEKTGTYSVKVEVSNRCGAAEAAQRFSILKPIIVSAEVSADTVCGLPARIQVTNKSEGDKLNFKWTVSGEFADKVVYAAALPSPEMTFRDTGVYIIRQEVFNDVCGSLTWRDTITILTAPMPVLLGQDRFCDKAFLTPQIDYLKYRVDSVRWDFAGGTPAFSTERKPVGITYGQGGEYRYTMRAFNYCGNTVVSDTVYVDTVPVFHLGPTDTICINEGAFQLPAAQPVGGTWLDSLRRPGVVTGSGVFDPEKARGGPSKIEYQYTTGACTASEFKEVYVVDLSYVDAGPDLNTCISDSMVFLKGGTPLGGWYRGEGVTDTLAGRFSPGRLAEGSYTLTYTYQLQGTKCIQSDPFKIYVRPLPKPAVQITDSICVNVPLTLNDRSTGGATYRWQVSPQAVYDQQSPRHTFTDTGYHQIRLRVGSLYGCIDSLQTEVYVARPPLTTFEKDTTMGCAILPVRLTNTTTGYRSLRYTWDFGNGDPLSTEEQPGTVYYPQGTQDTTYYIRLSAANYCGTDVAIDSVRVLPSPLVDLRINQRFACTPSRVVFNNLSKGLPRRYEWYMDGILFSEDSIAPAQVLRATGPGNSLYSIALVAHNECGSDTALQQVTVKPDSIRAFFEIDVTEGCEPLKVGFKNSTSPDSLTVYNWSFQQDGHTSNAKDTAFTFFAKKDTITRYTVSLLANNGCSENLFSTDITVFPSPRVELLAQDYACMREEVRFSSPTPALSGYTWDFGDGNTSKETSPAHRYSLSGEYRVQLTAYSARNACPGIDSQKVYIRPLPAPALEAGPLSGCPPHRITLENKTPNPDAYYYAWDFGDGRSVVGQNPGSHTYAKTGTYTMSLRAVDRFGCTNDTTAGIVRVFPEPEAQFAFAPQVPCGIPQQICMQNQSKGADAYIWDVGNNTPLSDFREPCATYTREGPYRVRLIARNSFLCSDTLEKQVIAYEKPVAQAEVAQPVACAEGRFQFSNRSKHADWVRWVFPGGKTDTTWSPLLRIALPGVYSVGLVAGNGSGCSDTFFLKDYFQVFPTPRAGMRVEKDLVAPPSTYSFIDDSSPDAIRYGWDLSDGLFSSQKNVVQRYISRFDREIRHWVSNEQGCADTVRYRLDLDTLGGLFVPNTLEPGNRSSERQLFTPKGIGLESWHIAVYTRGGQLIWESTELDKEGSPAQSWDGIFLGEEMPAGVYVWKVHYARFIDGSYWGGMPDEKGRPQKSGILYLLR
ncbi:MAG: PKD domain-containing protein, partial [Haliscomenobacter sp.]